MKSSTIYWLFYQKSECFIFQLIGIAFQRIFDIKQIFGDNIVKLKMPIVCHYMINFCNFRPSTCKTTLMKNFKPLMICIIMMLPFLVLGKTTGIDSKSELPPPVASITNNTGTTILTCTTGAISVTATGGISYSWSGGSSTGTDVNSFTSPGTYTVTVTGSDASTATASIVITQNITPPAVGITNNMGATNLTCSLTAISVTASPAGAAYAWSGGATPATATNSFTTFGNYAVTVTAANGCTATSSITITHNTFPPAVAITNNTGTTELTCSTTSISATATPAGSASYTWSGGASPATANNSFTTPGTYTVTVTGTNGCTATSSITISTPTIIVSSNSPVCVGTTLAISLTASSGGTSYAWSGPNFYTTLTQNPNIPSVSISSSGDYIVTVTYNGGCTLSAQTTVVVNPLPIAGITNNTGATLLTCSTTSISANAIPAGATSYLWSNGTTPATENNSFTTSGTYTVTVTGTSGCTSTSSIIITQDITPPAVEITNNTGTTILTCNTTSISVTANGGGIYAWSGGATPATDVNSFTTAGNYTVTVTAANGCTSTSSIIITHDTYSPTTAITNNTGTTELTCSTTSISATATPAGAASYAWSGGTTPATENNSFTTSGTYTVTVTGTNGCTSTSSIIITQNITSPTVGITNSTGTTLLTCSTASISVTSTPAGAASYAWSGGSTPATASNSFTTPDTYTVTVSGTNGCTSTSSIIITQDITPPMAAITNNTGTTELTCYTTSISVTATPTGAFSYIWNGGASPNTVTNSFTAPGNYTITVTGYNGCTSISNFTITQNITPPTAGITNNSGTTTLSCPSNTSISVTATPAGAESYVWDGGNNQDHDMNGLSSPGSYIVTVTATNGCTSTSSIVITQNGSIPTVTASSNSPVHLGEDINLTASPDGAANYAWSGPSGFSSMIQSPVIMSSSIPASLGFYTVTVTFAGGCTVTASTYVELETIYTTTNTGTTELNCSNTSISATVIDTVTSGTYLWNGGTSPNTATNTFTVPGTYTVTVSSTNGSTQTTSVTITQNITPPTVGITNNMGATQLTCALTTIGVTATPAGAVSYAWSGGATTGTAANSFNTQGTYTVTVTTPNGCTATSTILITQNTTPPAVAIINNSVTTQLSITITTINVTATGGGTYLWSGGTTPATASNSFTAPGTYIVTVTAANGCTSTSSITITTTGISDYAIDGLSVYYFNNRINVINKDNILVKEMIIYDMLGREVARYAIKNTNQISIDVNVSPANYIVKVVLDDRFGIYKLHVD